ncbi:DUF5606 domain-containing protein [Fulvivirgaceae bacterium LMO-SS25]
MEFNEIASITGKGGLYKIVKGGRQGVILESMDDAKKRILAGPATQVSLLEEISIYTVSDENTPLLEVFKAIKNEFGDDPGIEHDATPAELRSFMKHILPEHDEERVYPSNIKKLVAWYRIIIKLCPEVLEDKDEPRSEVDAPTQ